MLPEWLRHVYHWSELALFLISMAAKDRTPPSLSQLEKVENLGKGSFGQVWKVKVLSDLEPLRAGDICVLKECEIEDSGDHGNSVLDLVVKESEIMSQLSHFNIVRYYASWKEGSSFCILMEYAEKRDLAQAIKEHRQQETKFPEDTLWNCLIQIAQGLRYLHVEKHVLHRDIKPKNVFLDAKSNVKIGDLGESRLERASQDLAQTKNVGSPLYQAPEIVTEVEYDYRADIWSFGCVMYEMMALRPPFVATNAAALAHKICNETPAPLPTHYSSELQFLVMKMLEKDPSVRPDIESILSYSAVKIRIQRAKLRYKEARLVRKYEEMERGLQTRAMVQAEDLEKRMAAAVDEKTKALSVQLQEANERATEWRQKWIDLEASHRTLVRQYDLLNKAVMTIKKQESSLHSPSTSTPSSITLVDRLRGELAALKFHNAQLERELANLRASNEPPAPTKTDATPPRGREQPHATPEDVLSPPVVMRSSGGNVISTTRSRVRRQLIPENGGDVSASEPTHRSPRHSPSSAARATRSPGRMARSPLRSGDGIAVRPKTADVASSPSNRSVLSSSTMRSPSSSSGGRRPRSASSADRSKRQVSPSPARFRSLPGVSMSELSLCPAQYGAKFRPLPCAFGWKRLAGDAAGNMVNDRDGRPVGPRNEMWTGKVWLNKERFLLWKPTSGVVIVFRYNDSTSAAPNLRAVRVRYQYSTSFESIKFNGETLPVRDVQPSSYGILRSTRLHYVDLGDAAEPNAESEPILEFILEFDRANPVDEVYVMPRTDAVLRLLKMSTDQRDKFLRSALGLESDKENRPNSTPTRRIGRSAQKTPVSQQRSRRPSSGGRTGTQPTNNTAEALYAQLADQTRTPSPKRFVASQSAHYGGTSSLGSCSAAKERSTPVSMLRQPSPIGSARRTLYAGSHAPGSGTL